MNKKAVEKVGENPEPIEQEEIDSEVQDYDLKDTSLALSYIDKIHDFVRRNELLEVSATYYLYKFDNPVSGQSKSFISKFLDTDTPDEDQIGRKFGSGRYLVVMAIPPCEKAPKGHMRAYPIKIHPFYDTLRTEQLPTVPQSQSQPVIIQGSGGMKESIEMITSLIAALSPLFQAKQQPGPDMNSILFKTFENTQEVLKKSMLENVKVNSDLQRKLMAVENGENENMQTETEEEEPSLLEQFKPLLIEWLPKIMADNAQAKALQTVVKTAPQFKQIVNNKREFKTLVNYLDGTQGKEKTDKLLSSLKLKRLA